MVSHMQRYLGRRVNTTGQGGGMSTFFQDLRYAIRMMLKSPGVTATAIATLALGIGANTAIYSVVNSVLLRPLPFGHSSRIVSVFERLPGYDPNLPMNAPDYTAFLERQRSFDSMAIYSNKHFDLSGDGQPERVQSARVSYTLFPLLEAKPLIGRTFTADEDQPGRAVVVLSYGLWQRRFSSDRDILGRTIDLNRVPHTVIGVMPPSFQFPLKGEPYASEPAELWVPIAFTPAEYMGWGNQYNHSVLARLKPGVTMAQAQSDAVTVINEVSKLYPPDLLAYLQGKPPGIFVTPYAKVVTGNVRDPLMLLLVAVGIVLLIACANVANLLLARATGRHKEVAIRAALGADRWRLARQMLSENLLLGLVSGAIAIGVASWGVDLLLKLAPVDLPRVQEVHLDARVLIFSLLLSLGTALLFGSIPALEATHVDPNEALKEGGRGTGVSRGRRRVQNLLIVSQTALAVTLLVGAGLLVRSFAQLLKTDPGFRPEHVITVNLPLAQRAYPKAAQMRNFYQQTVQKAAALPGVTFAGMSTDLPLDSQEHDSVEIEGQPGKTQPSITHSWILGDYFQAMGISLHRGRLFTDSDKFGAPGVVIISENSARTYWPNQDPIGKRLKRGDAWVTVVGIVSDVKDTSVQAAAKPHTYTPYLQISDALLETTLFDELRSLNLAARTQSDPATLVPSIRDAVASLDSQVAISDIKTMEVAIHDSLAVQRFNLVLVSLFAGLAIFLAAVGVYGVLAYSVSQRTREIGIRIALGAPRNRVLGTTIFEGMRLTLVGATIGLIAGLILTRLMSGLLYGVTPHDPATYIVVIAVMSGVSFAACYIPAHRAMRVDPTDALRHE